MDHRAGGQQGYGGGDGPSSRGAYVREEFHVLFCIINGLWGHSVIRGWRGLPIAKARAQNYEARLSRRGLFEASGDGRIPPFTRGWDAGCAGNTFSFPERGTRVARVAREFEERGWIWKGFRMDLERV